MWKGHFEDLFFSFLSSTWLASDGRRQIDWSCRSCRSNHICNPQWHVYTETLRNGGHQRAGAAAPFHGVMKRKKILTFGTRKKKTLEVDETVGHVCTWRTHETIGRRSDRYRKWGSNLSPTEKRWFISPNYEKVTRAPFNARRMLIKCRPTYKSKFMPGINIYWK